MAPQNRVERAEKEIVEKKKEEKETLETFWKHREVVNALINLEYQEGSVGDILKEMGKKGHKPHESTLRKGVKDLIEHGILRLKERKEAERGGKKKIYEPSYLGWELNEYIGEMKRLVRSRPSETASEEEIDECIELLRSDDHHKRRVGGRRLNNLARRKDVLSYPKLIEFLVDLLENPSYDDMGIEILMPLGRIFHELPSRKLTEINTTGLKRRCLEGEDAIETFWAFSLLKLIDQDEALEIVPKMITELDDPQFPEYERWAREIAKLSVERKKKLRLKLFYLARDDSRRKVRERCQRIQSLSLWME